MRAVSSRMPVPLLDLKVQNPEGAFSVESPGLPRGTQPGRELEERMT